MGTIINAFAILLGSTIGYMLQARFPEKLKEHMLQGIGLVTVLIGIQMGLKSEQILYPLGGILLGGMVGYALKLEDRLEQFGIFLSDRFSVEENNSTFVQGFVTSSLIFCVGPMTILGAINDGLSGDYQLLAVKSVLDGFTSMALAASLGAGVFFSIITILVIQGGFTLSAIWMSSFFSPNVIAETTAAGGILIIGLGLVILNIKKLHVANFLPAIFIVPVLVKIISALL